MPHTPGEQLSKQKYMKQNRFIFLMTLVAAFPMRIFAQGNAITWTDLHASQQSISGISGQRGSYPYLRFVTDANDVFVRLVYKSRLNTYQTESVLYSLDVDGKWRPVKGSQTAGDTVLLSFHNLVVDAKHLETEYRLFLPLGAVPDFAAIGVTGQRQAAIMSQQPEKQIVIYKRIGDDRDSIPANTWPARLERVLDRPALVFDGAADHSAFLQAACTDTKAVFMELSAYRHVSKADGVFADIKILRHKGVQAVFVIPGKDQTKAQTVLLKKLKSLTLGIGGVFILPYPKANNWNDFQGQVRTDMGEPDGALATAKAIIQSRDRNYNWRQRHADELRLIKENPPRNVIFANSIIHYWGGYPQCTIARGQDSWQAQLQPLAVQNMGFGWDRIENVLWRIYHDELDGFKAEHVLLMIGTNNLQVNNDDEIIAGLRELIAAVKARQPRSRILISGIMPRRNMEARIAAINQTIAQLAVTSGMKFIDPGTVFLNDAGKIKEEFFGDGLHPNQKGYALLAPLIVQAFKDQ